MVGQAVPLDADSLRISFHACPPIWTLNLTQSTGKTGMSDTISPGDMVRAWGSHLSQHFALSLKERGSACTRELVLARFGALTV
jgi:hypothetical protein